MMVNGPWQIPTSRSKPDLDWQVAMLPQGQKSASILGGENYSIVKACKNVDAAWEFFTWTQEPENLKTYIVTAGKMPSRQDLAEDRTGRATRR